LIDGAALAPAVLGTLLFAASCNLVLPYEPWTGADGGPPDSAFTDADPADGDPVDAPASDSGVFDPDSQRVWQILPDGGPTPGWVHTSAAVYHAGRGSVVFYGGIDRTAGVSAELWEYTSSKGWSQIPASASSPGPRVGHGLAFDSKRAMVLLYGGIAVNDGAPMDDLWEWDGSDWHQPSTLGTPPGPRRDLMMAYDSARGRTVLFGGRASNGALVDDVHEYDGAEWTGPHRPQVRPAARENVDAAMTFVPASAALSPKVADRIVTCGGGITYSNPCNDCWAWDGTTWSKLCDPCTTSVRYASGLVHDGASGRLVLIGGYHGDGELAETWESTDGTTWKLVLNEPPARDSMAVAYSPADDLVLLHGGNGVPCRVPAVPPIQHPFNANCGDTWVYVRSPGP
jgi:hypothetical protein